MDKSVANGLQKNYHKMFQGASLLQTIIIIIIVIIDRPAVIFLYGSFISLIYSLVKAAADIAAANTWRGKH